MKVGRALLVPAALIPLAVLAYAFWRRALYPYDVEWMESGTLCEVLRFVDGQPVYAPPSIDFIPFLYTPLYPWLLAKLSGVVGVGYLAGRLVSIFAIVGALFLAYRYVRLATSSRAAALLVPGVVAASFVSTGAWLDLVRGDSLFLLLVTIGAFAAHGESDRPFSAVLSAAFLVLAFFTKQTASLFMVGLGLWMLTQSRRMALWYAGSLAIFGLPALWIANHTTDGWFWIYVSKLHRMHEVYPLNGLVVAPLRLVLLLAPLIVLVGWALLRHRTVQLTFAAWLAFVGIVTACLGFSTQWAYINAFIPAVFFIALAAGTALGILLEQRAERPIVPALALLGLLTSTGILVRGAAEVLPEPVGIPHAAYSLFDLPRFIPTASDRLQGDELIIRLSAVPGEVWVPWHPFYAHLAGKRTYAHRMNVMDIGRTGIGPPRGLAEAIHEQRFALIVMDDTARGGELAWPGLRQRYRVVGKVNGPRCFSGNVTRPVELMGPIPVVAPNHDIVQP